ncbi:MAG: hypothetical protein R3F43_26975 [bacterium]
MRIEGPAVHDLEVNFQQRWNQSLRHQRASLVGKLANLIRNRLLRRTPPLMADPEATDIGDRWVQIVRTPGGEGHPGRLQAGHRQRPQVHLHREPVLSRSHHRRGHRPRARQEPAPAAGGGGLAGQRRQGLPEIRAATGPAHTHRQIAEKLPDFKLTRLMVHDGNAAKAEDRYVQVDVHAKVMVIDDPLAHHRQRQHQRPWLQVRGPRSTRCCWMKRTPAPCGCG